MQTTTTSPWVGVVEVSTTTLSSEPTSSENSTTISLERQGAATWISTMVTAVATMATWVLGAATVATTTMEEAEEGNTTTRMAIIIKGPSVVRIVTTTTTTTVVVMGKIKTIIVEEQVEEENMACMGQTLQIAKVGLTIGIATIMEQVGMGRA